MHDDSFTYNGVDMWKQFKLRVLAYDLVLPPLRARKVEVPGRSGMYDYGAKYHDERILRMACTVEGALELYQLDELKYTLSRKGRIVLWDKPDRYYHGQLYDPEEVTDYFAHAMREFDFSFVCDPYAYAPEPTVLQSGAPMLKLTYEGTREAPTRITIRNNGTTALQGIRIIARERTY